LIRVEFTADDLVRTRHLPEPAPLVELKLSLMMLRRPDSAVLFGRWRRRLERSLPPSARPLFDLLSPYQGPAFIDPPSGSLAEGLEAVRASPGGLVRLGVDQRSGVLGQAARAAPTPGWLRGLRDDDAEAWDLLCRALQAAYEATLGPVWAEVERRHRAEFARYALATAEDGLTAGLAQLLPGARFHDGVWNVPAPYDRRVRLVGRGLVLVPTFHWTAAPALADVPDRPVLMAYPAGPGAPLSAESDDGRAQDALSGILGATRARVLRLLAEEHTTSEAARRLGLSVPAVSTHAAALRGAGLIDSRRDGSAVQHRRTALGRLLTDPGWSADPA
jgi:DNA-binding transcriptional ArsR family regulator